MKICIDALSNYLSPYIDYLYSLTSEKNRITVRCNRSINSYTHENCAIHLSRRQRKVINRFLWKIYVSVLRLCYSNLYRLVNLWILINKVKII